MPLTKHRFFVVMVCLSIFLTGTNSFGLNQKCGAVFLESNSGAHAQVLSSSGATFLKHTTSLTAVIGILKESSIASRQELPPHLQRKRGLTPQNIGSNEDVVYTEALFHNPFPRDGWKHAEREGHFPPYQGLTPAEVSRTKITLYFNLNVMSSNSLSHVNGGWHFGVKNETSIEASKMTKGAIWKTLIDTRGNEVLFDQRLNFDFKDIRIGVQKEAKQDLIALLTKQVSKAVDWEKIVVMERVPNYDLTPEQQAAKETQLQQRWEQHAEANWPLIVREAIHEIEFGNPWSKSARTVLYKEYQRLLAENLEEAESFKTWLIKRNPSSMRAIFESVAPAAAGGE